MSGNREVYMCSNCGNTKFYQDWKDEQRNIYDSVEHKVFEGGQFGTTSAWFCTECEEAILLKDLVHIFSGVTIVRDKIDVTFEELERLRVKIDAAFILLPFEDFSAEVAKMFTELYERFEFS